MIGLSSSEEALCPHCDPDIRTDHSLHIASLPRHRGLLRKIMSHQSKMFSIPRKGEFWRLTSNLADYRSEYSRFTVKNADGKSGSINSKVSRVLYSTPLCVTMMYPGLPPRASGYASLFFFSRSMLPTVVDTAFRIPCSLRGYRQFALVFADISPTIFNRNNRFQSQTARRTLEIPTYVLAYI